MTPKEQAAMQAAWVWMDWYASNNGTLEPVDLNETITALREALAEQAEQEPVVIFAQYYSDGTCRMQQFSNGITEWYGADGGLIIRSDASNPVVMDYAAPVRTKDLTDDEITNAWESMGRGFGKYTEFARAVIAADREKNK